MNVNLAKQYPDFRHGGGIGRKPEGLDFGSVMMYTEKVEATDSFTLSMASNHNAERTSDMAETKYSITRKTFKYRVSPKTSVVKGNLQHTLDLCRWLYNSALEERKTGYKDYGLKINYYDQQNQLPAIKNDCPELSIVGSHVLQDVLRRLDRAYKAFFQRCKQGCTPGHPRFKGSDRYDSFTFPDTAGWKLSGSKLRLRNIGTLNVMMHRKLEGNVKTLTIRRTSTGKWYACFSCEIDKPEPFPPTGSSVGIDVGLISFLSDNCGNHVDNPRWYRETERKLKIAQRIVSKRTKGSHRRRRAVRRLSLVHEKVSNQRSDFQHKLANKLIASNDLIAVEDLKIKNMVYNRHLAKSISDAGWGQFLSILSAKAEYAGRTVVKVDPRQTSQLCSGCGAVVQRALSVRIHRCSCGLTLDRDVNAARNILARALAISEGVRLQTTPADLRYPWI